MSRGIIRTWILAVAITSMGLPLHRAKAADNLIPNPSVEVSSSGQTPDQWQTGYLWGNLSASYQYLSTGYQSGRSLKVAVSQYVSGDAKWYFNPVAVSGNQTYRYSDSYQSTVSSHVVVAITKTGGSVAYTQLRDAPSSTNWSLYTDTFATPADASTLTVFHLISGNGSLTTDNFSLTTVSTGFNRPLVSLTFDDGWQSQSTAGVPILNQFGDKATFYIISGSVGNTASGYMSLAQVRALAQSGFEIGSHTVHHPDLTSLSRKKIDTELSGSLSYLKTNVTPSITNFAYPYGAYNSLTTTEVKKYYSSARTSDVGINTKAGFDVYRIQSQYVTPQTTLNQFQGWLDTARSQNAWLVVMYHQVDTSGSEYSVTPSMLSSQLQALQNSGLIVKTVNEALSELRSQL